MVRLYVVECVLMCVFFFSFIVEWLFDEDYMLQARLSKSLACKNYVQTYCHV